MVVLARCNGQLTPRSHVLTTYVFITGFRNKTDGSIERLIRSTTKTGLIQSIGKFLLYNARLTSDVHVTVRTNTQGRPENLIQTTISSTLAYRSSSMPCDVSIEEVFQQCWQKRGLQVLESMVLFCARVKDIIGRGQSTRHREIKGSPPGKILVIPRGDALLNQRRSDKVHSRQCIDGR